MTETLLDVPGAQLCAETFGDPADPAILLIGGAASAMDWWHEDFCRALADGDAALPAEPAGTADPARHPGASGRFVIRYDHRDTGRSRTDPPGAPSYGGDDLALDPVRVLDALGIGRAHLVGVSMGGGIAQQVAIEHPDRVASLTLMSTSPLTPGAPGQGADAAELAALPGPSAEVRAMFDSPPPDPDWGDPEAVVRYLAEAERAFAGTGYDEAASVATARQVVERSIDPAAAANHHLVEGSPVRGTLADVDVPTLVLHGEADPLFPPEHGVALAAAVWGARLVLLSGVGHQYPPRIAWGVVVPEILAVTRPPVTEPGAAPRNGPAVPAAPTTTASP
ncbi:alpha/beta fold hydrolase [Promicromonospora iranensis]|uniref:Pimeloyl-ACP methyl ester carboxylesterase n=1 Tax=Promicromonospora iranensis TaxID=1105144 RepID=A0ABU2CX77_9MICO|nr:alpha/beta hydrolase [Promicromonospora iranensis]MDR7385772.1 pimeloyl-ACP methyl ester carboxylesterase [Promicromonospora iranensis]